MAQAKKTPVREAIGRLRGFDIKVAPSYGSAARLCTLQSAVAGLASVYYLTLHPG
jgi:hypothetical protein